MSQVNCKDECYGYCCITDQSHPVTILTNQDVHDMARYLGLPEEEFRERYITRNWEGRMLQHFKFQPGPCVFFTGGLCGVQKAKPTTCRRYKPQETLGNITCKMWHRMRALGVP